MISEVIASFKQIGSFELLLFNATKSNLSHFLLERKAEFSLLTEVNGCIEKFFISL